MPVHDFLVGVGEKLLVGLALALLTLLSVRFRSWFFYKSVVYDLSYTRGMGAVAWDIEWEDFRLTISVGDVSNDQLHNVEFRRNKKGPVKMEALWASDKFTSLFDGEIQVKLNSILRRKLVDESKMVQFETDYVLRFVFRRRWFKFA